MNNTTDDVRFFLRAATFAAYKHRNHRRKDADATPYINHPLAVATALSEEGGVTDVRILAAALLHDTIEDTETTYEELATQFGKEIADFVQEVSDDKSLKKEVRKQLQIEKAVRASRAAQKIKIADKLCNLRDIIESPPKDWPVQRKREYFDWAKQVVDQIGHVNPALSEKFSEIYALRP